MMLSRNTNQKEKEIFSNLLGIPIVTNIESYLGLPTFIGKFITRSFGSLLNRIRKKLKMWKAHTFSFVGRETLIKAVAYGIPTYTMSDFLIPKRLCKKMDSLASRF